MTTPISQKVLIDLETKKAREEMKKLAASSGDTKEAFAKLDARAKELEKSIDGIKDAAGRGAPNFKALGNLMTPLNQGLEVGKKLLGLASDGMEAYAKTSKEAAGQVNALTIEFSKWKREVMENVGAIAVALGQSLPNVTQMEEIVRRMDKTGKPLHDTAADVSKELKGTGNVLDSVFGGLARFDYDGASKAIGEKIGGAFKKVAEDAKTARVEAARWRAEMAALGLKLVGSETPADRAIRQGEADRAAFQADVDRLSEQFSAEERATNAGLNAGGDPVANMSAAADALNEWREAAKALDDERSGRNLLKSTFGSIDELSLYRQELSTLLTVVDGFGNTVASSYEAIVTGQGSVSAAFKKVFSDQLMTLGKSSVVEAIKETALGFGALASYQYPAAALHFKSAALHGAVAIAAGAGAAALGAGSSSGGTTSGGGGSISNTRVGGGSYGNGQSQSQGERIIVVMNSSASQSPRMEYLEARRVTDLAFGGDGVTDR